MRLRKVAQVRQMSADELHRALVEDFVAGIVPDTPQGIATHLAAVKKISQERRTTPEQAFVAVKSEAIGLGASPRLFGDTGSAFTGHLQ